MNYEEDTKNITAYKLMEANDKIVTMADGKQYLDIREFNRIRKNLDSWVSVETLSKNPKYFEQPSIHFMTRDELNNEFEKFRQEEEKEIRKKRVKPIKEEKNDL